MSDLHAADCVRHQSCSVNFRTGRNIPHQYQCDEEYKRAEVSRPENELQRSAFLKTCDFLENNDEEQVTISDLVSIMIECLAGTDCTAYSRQYVKVKLIERYDDSLIISEKDGEQDVVTTRESVTRILRSYYKNIEDVDETRHKFRIIEAAARLLKSDIKLAQNLTYTHQRPI